MHLPVPSEVAHSQIFDVPDARASDVRTLNPLADTDRPESPKASGTRFAWHIR